MDRDLEHVYDDEISPLMAQILEICKREKMPMLASFQYGPEDFCSSALLADEYEAHERLHGAWEVIQPRARMSRFRMTTTAADGAVTVEDVVVVP